MITWADVGFQSGNRKCFGKRLKGKYRLVYRTSGKMFGMLAFKAAFGVKSSIKDDYDFTLV